MEHGQPGPQAIGPEKQLADADQHRRAGNLEPPVRQALSVHMEPFGPSQGERFREVFQQNPEEVIHAEEDKVPPCPVPQAVAQPHAEEGHGPRQQRAIVGAQPLSAPGSELLHGLCHGDGVEHIVLKPRAQGDVPPPPELCNVAGEEGPAEVFRQGHPEDLPAAHHQAHGAGKVHVQLDGVAHHRHSDDKSVILRISGEHLPDEEVQPVGHHHLFHQTEEDALHPKQEILPPDGGHRPQLVGGVAVPADGPLHDLGKEAHKQRQAEEVSVRLDLPSVHVKTVGHRLEGVKGDANGHGKGGNVHRQGQAQQLEQMVQVGGKEGGVLHQQQQPQVEHHPKGNNPRELPLEPAADGLPLLLGGGGQAAGPFCLDTLQPKADVVNRQGGKEQIGDQLPADRPKKR